MRFNIKNTGFIHKGTKGSLTQGIVIAGEKSICWVEFDITH